MLTAVVTRGARLEVHFVAAGEGQVDCEFPADNPTPEEPCDPGPSPIMPEVKELAWGAGAFIVLALLMRFVLYPRLKAGTDARYAKIREGIEQADTSRVTARAEVADYEAALATVRAEANARIDAARETLEAERSARLAEVTAGITARREAAAAEAAAVRAAAEGDIAAAVADVTSRTVELATGRAPDAEAVRRAVADAMGAGVPS